MLTHKYTEEARTNQQVATYLSEMLDQYHSDRKWFVLVKDFQLTKESFLENHIN